MNILLESYCKFCSLNFEIIPELFLLVTILFMLIIGLFTKSEIVGKIFKLKSTFFLAITAFLVASIPIENKLYLNKLFFINGFIIFSKLLIIITSILAILSHNDPLSKNSYIKYNELSILTLFSVLGILILISSNNFLTLYVGLELQSFAIYILVAINKNKQSSVEAGLKYFILGAFSTGIMLLGISLLYGASGYLSFDNIKLFLESNAPENHDAYLISLISLIFILTGILFKIASVPYHAWLPTVYKGTPSTIFAFIASAPKVASFVILMRILFDIFPSYYSDWKNIIIITAFLSIIIGALGALTQKSFRKFMAYSAINNTGFILLAFVSMNITGVTAFLIYISIYVTILIGIITSFFLAQERTNHTSEDDIDILAGYGYKDPFLAFLLTINLLSAAGIIPFAGFFAKLYVVTSLMSFKYYYLTGCAIILTIISVFYYLRVIKIMYFDKSDNNLITISSNRFLIRKILLIVIFLIQILFFLFHNQFINIINHYIHNIY